MSVIDKISHTLNKQSSMRQPPTYGAAGSGDGFGNLFDNRVSRRPSSGRVRQLKRSEQEILRMNRYALIEEVRVALVLSNILECYGLHDNLASDYRFSRKFYVCISVEVA